MTSFSKLTCIQLRQELAKRGAKTSGRKGELLQRLEDYERNQDFRSQPVIMPEEVIVDWPTGGFSQLTERHITNKDLPPVTAAHIDGYFMLRMGIDSHAVGDAQALKKGRLLLQSNRVEACSILQQGKEFYFSGMCRAAMKKSLSYSLKVKVGQYGDVVNSHCECPAGKGPHGTCKHIAALLLALVTAVEEGTLSGMNESCTDKLQTFHKPTKRYGGSPVKAEDLPGCLLGDMSDPRPLHLRNRPDRQHQMCNLVTNFVAHTGKDMAARYAIPKANLQVAVQDHDYLDAPFTEHLVQNYLEVTSEEAAAHERATTGQSCSSKWHAEREWRLTASRFGEICSITSRRNINKFCHSLLSREDIHSAAISHGRINEPFAIKEFEKKSGKEVEKCGLFIHPDHPYLAATPDGLVGQDAVLEVKCPYTGREKKIKPGKMFPFLEKKNRRLTLKRSHKHYDQVQGELWISKRSTCYFFVYTKVDSKIIDVPFDETYCMFSLLPKLKSFYDNHYLKFVATKL